MEDQDRQDSLEVLHDKDNWVIWKTKDDKWTHELRQTGFHQLLALDQNSRTDSWGNKIKGWCHRGNIKATKCKKTRECWVKSPANVPRETPKAIKDALLTPQQSYAKDNYTIDLAGQESTY
jgi:hypothetical protein